MDGTDDYSVETFIEKFKEIQFTKIGKSGSDIIEWLRSDKYTNKYHHETLFEHLMGSAKYAHDYAINKKKWPNSWIYIITGFMHDIGKIGAYQVRGKTISAKGHAHIGVAMLDSWILSENAFLTTFNLSHQDATDILAVVNYHMCGYFINANEN